MSIFYFSLERTKQKKQWEQWEQLKLNSVGSEYSRNSIAYEAVKTKEHYIKGPRKPVLQEKQVFLVLKYKKF